MRDKVVAQNFLFINPNPVYDGIGLKQLITKENNKLMKNIESHPQHK